MNKLCKIHPNMEQFLRENQYGMSKIEELAEKACEMYNDLRGGLELDKEIGLADRISESAYREYLNVKTVDALLSCKKKYLSYIHQCPKCGKRSKVHIYGYLKLGSRSTGELEADAQARYIKDEKTGGFFFDVDSMISVGPKVKPLHKGVDDIYSGVSTVVFDIDALLIRALNSANAVLNQDDVDKAILTIMLNRLITMMMCKNDLACLIEDCLKLHVGCIDSERSKNTDLREILKAVFIYRTWYNAVNDINDIDVDKSVESILELVDLASKSFNATQAIPDVFNTIHSKIMSGVMDVKRYPDRVVEKSMNYYRKAMNYYSFREDNGRRSHAIHVSRKAVIGVESLVADEFFMNFGTSITYRDKKRASLSLIGVENIQNSTKEFDEFKRKSRGAILAKLPQHERMTYIKFESDIVKFRAEAIGCRTDFSKSTILRRGETLAKYIQIEMGKNHSEEFITLMGMLDSERLAIQLDLANRDLFKERNTMLNGTIATKHEWDY